jgi:hypothetical protein
MARRRAGPVLTMPHSPEHMNQGFDESRWPTSMKGMTFRDKLTYMHAKVNMDAHGFYEERLDRLGKKYGDSNE